MAVLVAVAGAGATSALGFGASWGWIIGSVVGNLLFPGKGQTVEGPRLGDLSVTSSAYGAPMAAGFGTIRMGGNIIWARPIEEVKTSKKKGGKGGGPAVTTNTYTYFGSFAVSFGEGEAEDVLRIWADGKLVFDKRSNAEVINKNGLKFRFYAGSDTQTPDSLIVLDKGEAETPAYRGQCYIVFDRLPLADFGNRIPVITAEITFKAQQLLPFQQLQFLTDSLATSFQNDQLIPDYRRGVFYFAQTDGSVQDNNVIRKANLRTMQEIAQGRVGSYSGSIPTTSLELRLVMPNGLIVGSVSQSVGTNRFIVLIDPNTLQIVSAFGQTGSGNAANHSTGGFTLTDIGRCTYVLTGTGRQYALMGGILGNNSLGLLEVTTAKNLFYVWDSNTAGLSSGWPPNILGVTHGAVGTTFGEAYVLLGPVYAGNPSGTARLVKITVSDGAQYDPVSGATVGVRVDELGSYTPGDLIPGETTLTQVRGLSYDEIDDNVILEARAGSDTNIVRVVKLNTTSGQVMWRTAVPFMRNSLSGFNKGQELGGIYFGMASPGGNLAFYGLDTLTGEVLINYNEPLGGIPSIVTSGAHIWDGRTRTMLGISAGPSGIAKWLFFRATGEGRDLGEIVANVCQRVGFALADIDVSELTGTIVPGYALTRVSPARSILEQLAQVYYFDGVESDYVLKFKRRAGKSVEATISQDELGRLNRDKDRFFKENRVQDVDLPISYSLTFMDKDADYQQQMATAKRILLPEPTMNSRNVLGFEIPIALDVTTSKQTAEKGLFTAWNERSTYEYRLGWRFLELDPSDLVQVNLDDGTQFRMRLAQTDLGLDYSIELSGLSEIAAQYTSNAQGFGGEGPLVQTFPTDEFTKLFVLPTTLLRDSDDANRTVSRLYFGAAGYGSPGWRAATIWQSAEGTEYNFIASTTTELTWGTARNTLPDTSNPWVWDDVNTLNVVLSTNVEEGLSSATDLEVLNGANAALLSRRDGEYEIIQWVNATLNPDGSYTLSRLLRGRRGTDAFTSGHAIGDTFIVLSEDALARSDLQLGSLNTERFYRAVSSGQLFEDAETVTLASPGNDLKPYAPVHLSVASGSWGSTLTFNWVRRTRFGGELRDGTGGVPLAEGSEAYEVDIISNSGRVARTLSGLSTPSATYNSTQQEEDFPDGDWVDETIALLRNPSFELAIRDGWTVAQSGGSNTFARRSSFGNITAPHDGAFFLSLVESAGVTSATVSQVVDVSRYSHQIDAGDCAFRLSARIASNIADDDTGRVEIVWLNAAGADISTIASSEADPPNDGSWQLVSVDGIAPAGTRFLRVRLVGTRVTSNFLNVCWDDARLEVAESDRSAIRLRVYQMSEEVGRGFPSREAFLEV